MAGDIYYPNVSLLLPCSGANGSTTVPDKSASPKTVTCVGNAKISTALGDPALELDGSGDRLEIANSTALDFNTGSVDIECDVYIAGNSAGDTDGNRGAAIVSPWASGLVSGYVFGILGSTTTTGTGLHFDTWSGPGGQGTLFRASVTVKQSAWHRVKVSISEGVRRLFLDGSLLTGTQILVGGGFASASTFGRTLAVGATLNSLYPLQLNGYVKNLRITKGVARHTASYTPGSGPYPERLPILSGLVKDAANAPAERLIRAAREDTGALVGSATSDAGTGAYIISTTSEGAHTLNAYPAAGENLPALTLRGVIPV